MQTKIDIRKWREDKGWSQHYLASRLGVDQATVSRIERGEMEPSKSVSIILENIMQQPERAA